MATLYIVATPIGNLSDISGRMVDVLRSVDAIFCEDTRVTAKLLAHINIKKPLFSYHQHSDSGRIQEQLQGGAAIALVSDAGTPGINDPGGKLIHELLTQISDLRIVPIPGPNAAVAALSVCGFPADRYQYWGFVPTKKGRQTFFKELAVCEDTVVFYESKHRIEKTLAALAEAVPERPLCVARELTKQYETLYRGTAGSIQAALTPDLVRGEFVVVVAPKGWQ